MTDNCGLGHDVERICCLCAARVKNEIDELRAENARLRADASAAEGRADETIAELRATVEDFKAEVADLRRLVGVMDRIWGVQFAEAGPDHVEQADDREDAYAWQGGDPEAWVVFSDDDGKTWTRDGEA